MAKANLRIRLVKTKNEIKQILKVREIVFIEEQKIPKQIERDGFDISAEHFIVFYKRKPIGCARIRFIEKNAKLERIALLKKYRGKGFGKEIVDCLIRYCKITSVDKVVMNSQYYLKDFYKKFGFKTADKPFTEADMKHIKMQLIVRNSKKNI